MLRSLKKEKGDNSVCLLLLDQIRAPMFHLPMIRHTFAEHSIRYCLINLLNKDTHSTSIMERGDTDPYN